MTISRKTPVNTSFRQPDACRPVGLSGVIPPGVTGYAVKLPHCLGSVGIVVIVVGNYYFAAFYEASGASACNSGFHIHVETSAPPCQEE